MIEHRVNNFDALRLLGALLVAVSHTCTVMRGGDPLGDATGIQTLGGIGLNIFCIISGFLITRSRLADTPMNFFWSRALRIFPALFVAIPLMAVVFGPMFTTLSARDYFAAPGTWKFLATMFVFPLNATLPAVFSNAPVVAQLYSLAAELAFYVLVGIVAPWRHFKKLVTILVAATFLFFFHNNYITLPFSSQILLQIGETTVFQFPIRLGLTCVFYLLAGSMVTLYVDKPQRLVRFTPLLLVIWIAALFLPNRHQYDVIEMLAFPVLIIGLAFLKKVVIIPGFVGDLSYGIYIYHFFIAEAVATCISGGFRSGIATLLALLLSIVVAWISFRCVERPALSLKGMRKPMRQNVASANYPRSSVTEM